MSHAVTYHAGDLFLFVDGLLRRGRTQWLRDITREYTGSEGTGVFSRR